MAPAKKAAAKKATAKKATAKKATAKKATAKKATAKKATAKKATAKKATKRTAKKTTASSTQGNVVVASKLREAVKGHDIRMSGDLVDALNEHVHEVIAKAVERAKSNGRGTVRPNDL
jgi:histone H3/H4